MIVDRQPTGAGHPAPGFVTVRLPVLAVLGAWAVVQALPQPPARPQADWTPVVQGVDYRAYVFPLPNRVFVTRMDLSNPEIILDTSVAQGTLAQGKETVSRMAARYDGALNSWGGVWGPTHRVVAAINGSAYDLATGIPFDGQFQSGWMIQRYASNSGGSGVVWTRDREAFVGGCLQYNGEPHTVTLLRTGEAAEVDALNTARDDDGLWMYTSHFASHTPEGAAPIQVRIEVPRPIGPRPHPRMMQGVVRDLADGRHPFQIPFAYIVLTARGSTVERFLRSFEVGDRVGFSTDLVDLSLDCERRTGRNWSEAYASLGGGFVFLRNGQIRTSEDLGANTRDPRTAICLNDDFVYFVVVDGRQNAWSVGMTLDELAAFCRDELAATWGVNEDGGGSSAMWVDGALRNRPSDGGERAVGNGWLMLAVQPARRSNLFEEGFLVLTQGRAVLRLGPGAEYEGSEALPYGEQVTIAPILADVQGVWVRGSYWWKVALGEQEGWVPQDVLVSPDRLLAVFQIPPGD